jgi:hypothetical protein
VRTQTGTREGAFAGIDADGALLLHGPDGLVRITAGEAWFSNVPAPPAAR